MSYSKDYRTPFWYNAALACLKPLYRWKVKQRSGHLDDFQDEMTERFGPLQTAKNKNVIWFHAVSVGETNAAQPLIEHYLKLGQPILVTNTTRTGQARSKSLFAHKYPALFQAIFLPVDQVDLIERFLAINQPKILLLMETELWPNLLACVRKQQIPQLLLNARLSEKSAKGYGKVPSLTRPMLNNLNWIATQDQASQQRFAALGKTDAEMSTLGNMKFDITVPEKFLQQAQQLASDWDLVRRKIMVIASTHHPEEQDIVQALKPHLEADANLLCIVIPRHPERFDEIAEQIAKQNLNYQRRSLGQSIKADTQVYLADSMGELWLWCALSQVVYVGGSLNEPGGGHNILEPIALNKPTLLGKNYFNFQTIVDEFLAQQAVIVVASADQAVVHMLSLIGNPQQAMSQDQRAQTVMQRNQGSVQRHIQLIDRFLSA